MTDPTRPVRDQGFVGRHPDWHQIAVARLRERDAARAERDALRATVDEQAKQLRAVRALADEWESEPAPLLGPLYAADLLRALDGATLIQRESIENALENDRCGICLSVSHFREDCPDGATQAAPRPVPLDTMEDWDGEVLRRTLATPTPACLPGCRVDGEHEPDGGRMVVAAVWIDHEPGCPNGPAAQGVPLTEDPQR